MAVNKMKSNVKAANKPCLLRRGFISKHKHQMCHYCLAECAKVSTAFTNNRNVDVDAAGPRNNTVASGHLIVFRLMNETLVSLRSHFAQIFYADTTWNRILVDNEKQIDVAARFSMLDGCMRLVSSYMPRTPPRPPFSQFPATASPFRAAGITIFEHLPRDVTPLASVSQVRHRHLSA